MKNKIKPYNLSDRNKKCISGSFRAPQNKKNYSVIWFIIVFLIIIFLFIYLLFSGFFSIKKIEINGLININKDKIEKIVQEQQDSGFLFFSQSNLLFFNKNKLIKTLNDYNFAEILIEKRLMKRSLVINIKEREQAFVFFENNNYFFSDKNGAIINYSPLCSDLENNNLNQENNLEVNPQLNSENNNENSQENFDSEIINLNLINSVNQLEEKNNLEPIDNLECLTIDETYKRDHLYPIIENEGKNRTDNNKKQIKLDPEYIDFTLKLYNDLSDNSDFGLNKIVLDEEYNTVKIRLNNGLEVYFSFKSDYLEQLSRFFALKKEKGDELRGKKYIDLRYGDKIFYY